MTSLFFKEKKEAIFCCRRFLSLPLHAFPPVFQTFILKSRRNHKVWISCCFLCHKLKPEGCEYHEFEWTSFLRSMHLKKQTLEADTLLFHLSWSMKIKDPFQAFFSSSMTASKLPFGPWLWVYHRHLPHPTPHNYDHGLSFNWQSWRGRGSEVDAID